jgi:hypothetical protein
LARILKLITISLIFQIFGGPQPTVDTESMETAVHLYYLMRFFI